MLYRRESIKIGPPLTITKEALKEGLEIIEESVEKYLKMSKIRHTGIVTNNLKKSLILE